MKNDISKKAYSFLMIFSAANVASDSGRVVIWRHSAMHRVAPAGTPSQRLANKGRSPVPRFALVGNNRKLRYLGHVASVTMPNRPALESGRSMTFLWHRRERYIV